MVTDSEHDTRPKSVIISRTVSNLASACLLSKTSLLALALYAAPVLSLCVSASHRLEDPCWDVYGSAKLLAVLITLVQAAAGEVGCLSG